MQRLTRWWRARQRAIDCAVLWPECVAAAGSLEGAKTAFMMHAFNDSAWVAVYEDGLWAKIDTFTETEASP